MINFLSDEKLAMIETGDIVITKMTQEGQLLNRENFDIAQKNIDEKIFDIEWFFVGRDSDGDAVGIKLDSNDVDQSAYQVSCWEFSKEEYGSSFNLLNEKFNKFPIEERKNLDLHLSRYIYNEWFFDVKKYKSKTLILGGMNCCECNEYYNYAIPNLSDKRMACWSCRDSYGWKYSNLYIG